MNEPNFILGIENELDRFGVKSLICLHIEKAKVLEANNLQEIHKLLFENEDAVIVINSDFFEPSIFKQTIALSHCFVKSKWLLLCNDISDDVFFSEIINANNNINLVLTSDSLVVLKEAVFSTLHGQTFISQDVEDILEYIKQRKNKGENKKSLLTSTELEIIQLIVQGKSAKEIADIRFLSIHTVNTHRKNIFRKLEINNVQELIKYALKIGLLDLTEYYI